MFFFSKFTLAANFHYCEDSSNSFGKNPQLVYILNPLSVYRIRKMYAESS
jgi:hypothetical protein